MCHIFVFSLSNFEFAAANASCDFISKYFLNHFIGIMPVVLSVFKADLNRIIPLVCNNLASSNDLLLIRVLLPYADAAKSFLWTFLCLPSLLITTALVYSLHLLIC